MACLSAGDAEKLLHTELALDPNEVCDTYSHTSDEIGDVTFNLKDFKHMLSLCEAFNANVMLSFGMPGAAVVAAPAFAGDQVSANARASWHALAALTAALTVADMHCLLTPMPLMVSVSAQPVHQPKCDWVPQHHWQSPR